MMGQHAVVDANGMATAFYDDALHEAVPAGAIALDGGTYAAWVADSQGQAWRDGALVAVPIAALPLSAEEIAAGLQTAARLALDASDTTIVRCVEHAVAVPAEWIAYRAALRAIVAGTSSAALPAKPAYPAGT